MTYTEARAMSEASAAAARREYATGRTVSGAAHADMADEFARAASLMSIKSGNGI